MHLKAQYLGKSLLLLYFNCYSILVLSLDNQVPCVVMSFLA